MKSTFKMKKGITLIALVVTIIVLLILAGVSISMLTGQNGILNRAKEAKENTELAQAEEDEKMQGYEDTINRYKDLPTGEGTKPYLPNSTFLYKEGDLSTGVVIKDSNYNEYVWVEVPKTVTVYETAGVNITNFTEDNYTKIENDLKSYTNEYKADDYSDTNQNFTIQYKKMLKSVYENGGFWVGRYEAGSQADGNSVNVVVKQNAIPYINVTRDESQTLAEGMNYEGCTSSLIFGLQWDLMLKFIETKNATAKENLILDSTEIGNYTNNLWNITDAKVKYSTDYGNSFTKCPHEKKSDDIILLTTGAKKDFSLMNIYDIAGNVYEWTLETGNDEDLFVYRGGNYGNNGEGTTAKYRYGYNQEFSGNGVGFRIGLWK